MPLTQVSSRAIEDTLRYVLGASGTNHYTFTGKGLTGAVNDPTLTLSRGHTYIFENRSGGHPFYIKTSIANGGTNDQYSTGVTNNGGGNGTEIVFTVPHDAPDTLYYQCSSHSSMAGQLSISGSVADGSITTAKLAADAVDGTKIADDAINSEHFVDGSIDTAHIADDAVTADKLANSINTAIAANTAKDLTALSASNLTSGTIPDARLPATLPAISGANLTGISSTSAACTPNVGGSSNVNTAVANNLTYTNVTGNYLLGNVTSYLSASTIYGIEAYVELHHHSSSASHGYLGGWLYQTGKTYNVDGVYFQNNMYNAYSTALRFTYLMPWDPSGTQSLSLYITSSLETGTNNYFNIGVQNKLENV